MVKTLLSDLPPLEQRPHKKIPQRQLSITKTDEWDFHDTEEKNTTTVPEKETSQPVSHQPKRHISFGDVVVRNPPQPFSAPNSTSQSASQQTTTTTTTAAAEIIVPQKKSRFVVEEISQDGTIHTLPPQGGGGEQLTLTPPSISRDSSLSDNVMLQVPGGDEDQEIKRGRFSVKQGGGSEYPTVSSVESAVSSDNTALGGDRRSRFEIQHGDNNSNNTPIITSVTSATTTTSSQPLSRANSVSSSSNGISLTRDGSTHSRMTKYPVSTLDEQQSSVESRKMIGRFELTTSEAIVRPSMSHSNSDKGPEGKDSFIVTRECHSYSMVLGIHESSPSSSVSGQSSSTSPSASLLRGQGMRDVASRTLPTNIQTQLEELFKVNEKQQHMLQELSSMIHAASKPAISSKQHSSLSISESFSERYVYTHMGLSKC